MGTLLTGSCLEIGIGWQEKFSTHANYSLTIGEFDQ